MRLRSPALLLICFICLHPVRAQNNAAIDPWVITAKSPDPANYYGVTVANGMIGIVSSPLPFQVKDVVLAGAYDLYGRGRVSNFLKSFNLLNMRFSVDDADISAKNISSLKQTLDMQRASFTTSFDYLDKASITYTYYALASIAFYGVDGYYRESKKRYPDYTRQYNGSTGCPTGRTELL